VRAFPAWKEMPIRYWAAPCRAANCPKVIAGQDSAGSPATVYHEFGSSHPAGGIRHQVTDGVGDIFRLTKTDQVGTLEGSAGGGFVRHQADSDHVVEGLVTQLRAHHARMHRVDADAIAQATALDGRCLAHQADGTLGGAVGTQRGGGTDAGPGGHVDNGSTTPGHSARTHGADGVLDTEKHAGDVDVHGAVEVVQGTVGKKGCGLDAGVVHHHV